MFWRGLYRGRSGLRRDNFFKTSEDVLGVEAEFSRISLEKQARISAGQHVKIAIFKCLQKPGRDPRALENFVNAQTQTFALRFEQLGDVSFCIGHGKFYEWISGMAAQGDCPVKR